VQVTSNPVNGASKPKFVPGAEAPYTLNVTNSGTGGIDNNTLDVVDLIPANTELFTGNLSGGAPIVFVDGPDQRPDLRLIALNNFTDCVDFSNIGGAIWV